MCKTLILLFVMTIGCLQASDNSRKRRDALRDAFMGAPHNTGPNVVSSSQSMTSQSLRQLEANAYGSVPFDNPHFTFFHTYFLANPDRAAAFLSGQQLVVPDSEMPQHVAATNTFVPTGEVVQATQHQSGFDQYLNDFYVHLDAARTALQFGDNARLNEGLHYARNNIRHSFGDLIRFCDKNNADHLQRLHAAEDALVEWQIGNPSALVFWDDRFRYLNLPFLKYNWSNKRNPKPRNNHSALLPPSYVTHAARQLHVGQQQVGPGRNDADDDDAQENTVPANLSSVAAEYHQRRQAEWDRADHQKAPKRRRKW